MKTFFCIAVFITCLILPFSGYSQEPTNTENIISVKTTLVNIPLIISDKTGRRISDISKDEISIYAGENKLEIDFFADSNEPVSYAILIDTSGSTSRIRGKINNAARRFVDTFTEADQGMVVRFDDKISILQKLTPQKSKIKSAISAAETVPGGIGLMNETILKVSEQFKEIKGRKAIIILTDAGEINLETNSIVTKTLLSNDIVAYPIFYQGDNLLHILTRSNEKTVMNTISKRKSLSLDELVRLSPFNHLSSISMVSGGRILIAESDNFETAFMNIADELRKQYVVGFYVDADSDADTRNISIKVNRPDAVVRTKSSIRIAPTQ